ncbi:large ribosomal subunit protein uL1 [Neocloeon triangulifer]|uniref:large ribosomal subunit protein uL1 n=1 Tax=Neocloeon triangulifer TaxID=2078957 RepID=UPI00286EEAFC|nr:large ribosomal subunit protein uL1 [Neocloeon triangulifer]
MAAPTGLLTRTVAGALLGRSLINSLLRPTCVEPCRGMAARKGIRKEKARKRTKVEIQKVVFDPLSQRSKKNQVAFKPKMDDDLWRPVPMDDVYPFKYFQQPKYSFEEAVQCHRETHDPTMYNRPDALLKLVVELDLHGERKTKFLEKLFGLVDTPHPFDQQIKRTIVVFTKNGDDKNKALAAGASVAGGSELIKGIQSGDVTLRNVDFVICTPDILSELVPLRGVFKRAYPSTKQGSVTQNTTDAVRRFLNGIEYIVEKDDREPEFGWFECNIGTLNMPTENLKENMMAIAKDLISKAPPKKQEPILWRLFLSSPPGFEKFKLDLFPLFGIQEYSIRKRRKPDTKEDKPKVTMPKESEDDAEKVAVSQ